MSTQTIYQISGLGLFLVGLWFTFQANSAKKVKSLVPVKAKRQNRPRK